MNLGSEIRRGRSVLIHVHVHVHVHIHLHVYVRACTKGPYAYTRYSRYTSVQAYAYLAGRLPINPPHPSKWSFSRCTRAPKPRGIHPSTRLLLSRTCRSAVHCVIDSGICPPKRRHPPGGVRWLVHLLKHLSIRLAVRVLSILSVSPSLRPAHVCIPLVPRFKSQRRRRSPMRSGRLPSTRLQRERDSVASDVHRQSSSGIGPSTMVDARLSVSSAAQRPREGGIGPFRR